MYQYFTCVQINDMYTEWFTTTSGVRQGDNLSPTLFALFINDLAVELKSLQKGIMIDNYNLALLMYADDIVVISESESDMQVMLDHICNWCSKWKILVNTVKSKVVHFRKNSQARSEFEFTLGEHVLNYVENYKYLGVVLNEFLDFTVTCNNLAQSASRALGEINSKFEVLKNLGFSTYSKMYDTCVVPILDYCSSVWGFGQHVQCDAIQHRAFLEFTDLLQFML